MNGLEAVVAVSIPIFFAFALAFAWWAHVRARERHRAEIQKTLRAMIDKGLPVSPELLRQFDVEATLRERDLRWGVTLTALGLGIVLFGVFMDGLGPRADLDDVLDYVAIASIVIVIGLTRLGFWMFAKPAQGSQ